MDRTTTHRQRMVALDGLRGFAALSVVFAHLVIHMGLLPWEPLGLMGVIVFFALSGYLIAGIVWRTEPTFAAYRQFVARRVRRLLPVLVVFVLVTALLLQRVGGEPVGTVLRDAFAALGQVTAFVRGAGLDTHPLFLTTWSLTVEWTFYLVAPVVLFLMRRRGVGAGTGRTGLFAAAGTLYALGLTLDELRFYLLPVANLGVLVAGAALALSHIDRDERGVAGTKDPAYARMAAVMLGILVILPGDSLSWGWKLSVVPAATVATLVVIHGCWSGVSIQRTLSAPWLRAIGVRAYSLYLWHLPVMWLAWVALPDTSPLLRASISLAAIIPVVALSYGVLELPFLSPVRGTSRVQWALRRRGARIRVKRAAPQH